MFHVTVAVATLATIILLNGDRSFFFHSRRILPSHCCESCVRVNGKWEYNVYLHFSSSLFISSVWIYEFSKRFVPIYPVSSSYSPPVGPGLFSLLLIMNRLCSRKSPSSRINAPYISRLNWWSHTAGPQFVVPLSPQPSLTSANNDDCERIVVVIHIPSPW